MEAIPVTIFLKTMLEIMLPRSVRHTRIVLRAEQYDDSFMRHKLCCDLTREMGVFDFLIS